jgi:hypothetical protein
MKRSTILLLAACCFSLTGCFAALDVTYTTADGRSVRFTGKQPISSQK